MKRTLLKISCLALSGFVLVLLGCTYGKWEFLSWRYASEFDIPIQQAINEGCLSEYPKVIKVMSYRRHSALIWFKGESGSTWIAKPSRSSRQSNWQFRKSGASENYYCDIDVINSTFGGSADGYYWYK